MRLSTLCDSAKRADFCELSLVASPSRKKTKASTSSSGSEEQEAMKIGAKSRSRRSDFIFDWLFVIALNHVFNWSTIKFFKSGVFKICIPGLIWETHRNLRAMDSLDFFGLNYYSHNHIKFNPFKKDYSELMYHPADTMTDMP